MSDEPAPEGMSWTEGSYDLPVRDTLICTQVEIDVSTVQAIRDEAAEVWPALIFTFRLDEGGKMPPVVLTMPSSMMPGLAELLSAAMVRAMREAAR